MTKTIGILSSSRADFSIYLPLIKELQEFQFNVEIIAFGTHMAPEYGNTVDLIESEGFIVKHKLKNCYATGETPLNVSLAMATTTKIFAQFWTENRFDLVFCLGDRYEMFAAVSAGLSFQVNFAHIHGGETTLGAIDNSFRHAITHMSRWHFAACEQYKLRIIELTNSPNTVFNSGALSLDNIRTLKTLSIQDLNSKTELDFNRPVILCTFHPETVQFEKNALFAEEISNAFEKLIDYQILITLPNSDTGGLLIRKRFIELQSKFPDRIKTVENLGNIGYISAMKHCTLMVGNTSSGFIEAAYFPKTVINLGDRQKGRIITKNIINSPIECNAIMSAIQTNHMNNYTNNEAKIYGEGFAANKISNILDKLIFAQSDDR